jgi:hypothetical protein
VIAYLINVAYIFLRLLKSNILNNCFYFSLEYQSSRHYNHHHQFLLLLAEHRASIKSFQICDLQLAPWPHSMIFLYLLFRPLLSIVTFSLAYLFVCILEDSNPMRVSPLLLLLYVMSVLSNTIFFFFIWISIDFCLVILHSSSFVFLSVYFIFIIRLKHLFINVCNLLVIWLIVFHVTQAYINTDFTYVLNIRILTPFDMYGSIIQEVNLNLC